jgi:phosphohistidine phosphatase SixA
MFYNFITTATRARSTAEAVAKASGYKGEIDLDKSLYAAGADAYLNVCSICLMNMLERR